MRPPVGPCLERENLGMVQEGYLNFMCLRNS